ncbi:MAG: hypothetical protein WKF80_01255 [Thermomicrobiales bacterium]
MLIAAMVLLGGFVLIYGALEPYTRDFVAADVPQDPTPSVEPARATESTAALSGPGEEPSAAAGEDPTSAADEEPTPEGDGPAPTPTATTGPITIAEDDTAFEPDYQVDPGADTGINFRTAPSIAGGQSTVIIALPPGTQLESQGEQREDAENPAENGTWLLFQTEDGQEGWVREIDVVQI